MRKKTSGYTIILGIFFFIIIVYNIISFNNMVNVEFEKSLRNTLIDMADQQQISLERQLESLLYNLTSLSETLTFMSEDDPDEVLEFIESKRDILHFDTVSISDTNGNVLLATSPITSIAHEDYFSAALTGEVFATETHISPTSGNEVITVGVPMYFQGETVAVLAVEFSTEYLNSLLTKFTDENGLNLIINSDSEILLSTSSFVISFDAFANADFDEGFSFEDIKSDFKSGKNGSISYSINGIQKLGEYRQLSINDWILFFEISEENVTASATAISNRMIFVSVTIVSLSFAIILIILFSRRSHLQDLEKIAYYDSLTGSPNLLKFKMHVETTIKNNPNAKYAMVKLDVANFKGINEVYGFEVANKVLCAITETSTKVKEKTFMQARVNADEFLLFSGGGDLERLERTKEHYEAHFKTLVPELHEHNFHFRYGRYFIEQGETDVNEMINKTDIAHKLSKSSSTSNLYDYNDNHMKKVLKETEIANKMHKALANNEFCAYFQPKFDIVEKKIVGAEALVRWLEPSGNMMFPNEFIPLFEQNGFIIDLDKYILKSVCNSIKLWQEQGYQLVPISVNFSRLHIHNINFVSDLKQIVSSYGIETSYIEIELTETTVLENENELLSILSELRKAGFLVSIDDFGSGYSSLGMLKNFNVDTLKLDRSFFINASDKTAFDRGNYVVESIISLARALDMHTVAEGIETEEQVNFLKSVKCFVAQGYYYSKPIPSSEFETQYLK